MGSFGKYTQVQNHLKKRKWLILKNTLKKITHKNVCVENVCPTDGRTHRPRFCFKKLNVTTPAASLKLRS
jgi:hypothetical protein